MAIENRQTEIDPEADAGPVSPQARPARLAPKTRLLPTTSPPAASLLSEEDCFIGTVLVGRYLIEKKLGQGGMGVVYLGRDQRLLNKPIVVKILQGEFAANDWVIRKFLQEKEALTRANHPGIVGILDAGELPGGNPFIVMEFIDGITLEAAITTKGMTLERTGHLLKQIGSALAAAHDKGIYHRDLKPANIMLQSLNGADEAVRIIDFGVAKVHDSVVADHTLAGRFGTYLYMSPEQFRVEKITAASDIYAMGAMAYEMLTGRPPMDPKQFINLGDMYTTGVKVMPKQLRPDLPERAQKLILKALSLKPQDRFQNALEFGDELSLALAPNTRKSRRPVSWDLIAKRLRVQPYLLRLSVSVLAIVAFIAVAMLFAVRLFAPALQRTPVGRDTSALGELRERPLPNAPAEAGVATESSLTYWLTVQKANERSSKKTFESSGEERFANGDAFQLNVIAEKPGYLYVLNEGATDNGTMNFTMIYPTRIVGNGSAKLESGLTVKTGSNKFGGLPGREQFWMVWSSAPIAPLEAARDRAFRTNGRLSDETLAIGVRDFFARHYDALSPPAEETLNHRTIIKSKTNLLVKLLELQHH